MKKILLITTGGTLACTPSAQGLTPTLKGADILAYAKETVENIEVLDFKLIDSSVMIDEDRHALAQLIWEKYTEYDSFIITHGTDSMAYTAAYLDCCLHHFDKTIVITGAQLPLIEQGTDAVDNLNLAIKTANAPGFYGVCLAIYNRLLPAKTATKTHTEGFVAFQTVDQEYLINPIPSPQEKAQLLPFYQKKVGVLTITPNLEAQTIALYQNMDGVLVQVLGAGGMLEKQQEALEQLKQQGVAIYMKSQCTFGKVEAIYQAHSGIAKFLCLPQVSLEWAVYAILFGIL